MGIVDQPVEDGVGKCRVVADDFVPVIDGHLTGNDGGGFAIAVLEHFEQVDALASIATIQGSKPDRNASNFLLEIFRRESTEPSMLAA